MKRIVVTGGSGKLGHEVIQNLVAHGYETLNLDRTPPQQKLGQFRLADCVKAAIFMRRAKALPGLFQHLPGRRSPRRWRSASARWPQARWPTHCFGASTSDPPLNR